MKMSENIKNLFRKEKQYDGYLLFRSKTNPNLRYFARPGHTKGTPIDKPEGYKIRKSIKTGMPMLVKQKEPSEKTLKIKNVLWEGKRKFITIAVIIIAIIAVWHFVSDGPDVVDEVASFSGLSIPLYSNYEGNEGWNEVMFTQMILYFQEDKTPEAIFSSISGSILWVVEDETGDNWQPGGGGPLDEIKPYTLYNVQVKNDCTLVLKI